MIGVTEKNKALVGDKEEGFSFDQGGQGDIYGKVTPSKHVTEGSKQAIGRKASQQEGELSG